MRNMRNMHWTIDTFFLCYLQQCLWWWYCMILTHFLRSSSNIDDSNQFLVLVSSTTNATYFGMHVMDKPNEKAHPWSMVIIKRCHNSKWLQVASCTVVAILLFGLVVVATSLILNGIVHAYFCTISKYRIWIRPNRRWTSSVLRRQQFRVMPNS